MKALVLKAPNKLELEERSIPVPGPNDVLIKIMASSICHTDYILISGEHPNLKFPRVIGHEFGGIVEGCGQYVTHVKPGDIVTANGIGSCGDCSYCHRGEYARCKEFQNIAIHMDGGYQEYTLLPASMVYPTGNSMSFEEAAMVEPAANAYGIIEQAQISIGENVVVIGPGPIGLLTVNAALLKHPDSIIMVGTRQERLDLAVRLGATSTINIRETDPYDAIMELTKGKGADVVYWCGGEQDAWDLAGNVLAPYGRMIIEARPSQLEAKWPVRVCNFCDNLISYISARGYTPVQFDTTIKLISSGKLNVKPLITHRFLIEDYKEAFETSASRKDGAIKVTFSMN